MYFLSIKKRIRGRIFFFFLSDDSRIKVPFNIQYTFRRTSSSYVSIVSSSNNFVMVANLIIVVVSTVGIPIFNPRSTKYG